tara:strand:- start:458 stop:634 length:177 start_codon:yes stop_codon:yes gene_type:complete
MADTKYIYESPDGGKTIYRRESGDYDNREKITMEVDEDYWVVSKPENIEIEYINSEEE